MPADRLSPCPQCDAPCDGAQRYCLSCGAARSGESARLAAPAPADATSVSSSSHGDDELTLVPPAGPDDPVPLREDRRALTSFGLGLAGVLLLLVGGWGTDTAQTLASALPPGLSVTYPASPGLAAGAATAAAVTDDDMPVDDPPVDEVTPADEGVVDEAPADDAPVDDAVADDRATADDPASTGDTTTTDGAAAEDEQAPPPIKHVYMIVLADQDVAAAAQTPDAAPYLAKTLAPRGTILSGYRAIAAAGLPNAVALISGQGPTPEIMAGCAAYADVTPGTIGRDGQELGAGCAFSVQTGTIGDQLAGAGAAWRAYTPDPAGTGCVEGATGARRAPPADVGTPANPFASFHTATDAADCPRQLASLDALTADLAAGDSAPALSYIQAPPVAAPDPATSSSRTSRPRSGPDVRLAATDTWLSTIVPEILASKGYADGGLLVVTSDRTDVNGADDPACCRPTTYPNLKADGGQGGRVGALLVSPYVAEGKVVDTSYSHFTLLRSIEDVFGLEPLGYAGLKTVGSLVPDVIEPERP